MLAQAVSTELTHLSMCVRIYVFAFRSYDVYMGIDTFGRGTWGGGGFDVDKALGKIRRAGVSAALFAPAWTMEEETTGLDVSWKCAILTIVPR